MKYNSELLVRVVRSKMLVDKKTNTSMTSAKASELIGISQSSFCRIMKGASPDIVTMFKIARWLETTMEYFFIKHKK